MTRTYLADETLDHTNGHTYIKSKKSTNWGQGESRMNGRGWWQWITVEVLTVTAFTKSEVYYSHILLLVSFQKELCNGILRELLHKYTESGSKKHNWWKEVDRITLPTRSNFETQLAASHWGMWSADCLQLSTTSESDLAADMPNLMSHFLRDAWILWLSNSISKVA